MKEAELVISKGLNINPINSWERHLKYDVDSAIYGELAAQNQLFEYLTTCFTTTSGIWGRVKAYRSFPKGPQSLTAFLNDLDKQTILLVVPEVLMWG